MKENKVEVNVPGENEADRVGSIVHAEGSLKNEEKKKPTVNKKNKATKDSKKTIKETTAKTAVKKITAKKEISQPEVSGEHRAIKKGTKKKDVIAETSKVVKKNTSKNITSLEPGQQATSRKTSAKKKITAKDVKLTFVVRFHTKFGQSLYITGQHEIFGNNDIAKAIPMQYLNEEFWTATLELNIADIPSEGIAYNYLMKYEDGNLSFDWGSDKKISADLFTAEDALIIDSWNFAGYYENSFYTEPFKHVLLKNNFTPLKITAPKNFTHTFKVKAPLLEKGQAVFIAGNGNELGDWGKGQPILMSRTEDEDFFSVKLDLSKSAFPVIYKYGVYDTKSEMIVRFEGGNNRVLHDAFIKTKKTVVNDGFIVMPDTTWKGAGVAIPVFSLRSKNSFGTGEFTDIKLLVDWAKKVGLKLVQILPVNDTYLNSSIKKFTRQFLMT